MSFEVLDGGMLALLQDPGRYGYQHIGVTTGGPMDEHAFRWANRLLDNPPEAAQIEINIGKLSLLAHEDTCIALTGADLGAQINGEAAAPWHTYQIHRGDHIEFGMPVAGLRAYLAVAGGLKPTVKLGSCATVVREGLGGLDGRGQKLAKGDCIGFDRSHPKTMTRLPAGEIPDYNQDLHIGVIPSYQYPHFSPGERMKFFTGSYEVSQRIDRMGYRLTGDPIHSELDGIISEGIAYGAIQVPSDGQPIVLMKDRQTIGGYPKIGCLSTLDAGQLAQRGPGALVRFYLSDVADAEAQRAIFNHKLERWKPLFPGP
ncbi:MULTISPECIES: biotin-dependent carboxyltransferase family protein [Marinobacter]|uniref:5-oxoprolinase subunit C family protein n=4 Tax=Marinobacteraceae TaxID=2887365 RepID=UPI002942D1C1|nr:biotin-dependent carboxyltransferase family protein [Marinobacter salarius]WOI20720.1 biotin-dependent carboxyltransferase family protein [Marinobacter salarius]